MRILTLSLALIFLFSSFSCQKEKNKIDWTEVPDSLKDKNGNIDQSKIDKSKIQKPTEDVTFTTSDKKEISGSFYFQDTKKNEVQPLVILIHQFNQTREQWQNSFRDSLLNTGYKVLAYDIRGHGKSTKQNGKLEDLLTDPEQATNDIKAVLEWAKKQKGIDSTRIAIIGTSIGGNIALYAGLNLGVKVPVAVSNGKQTFEAYTGFNELMMGRPNFPKMQNALLICGNKDGDHEAGQKWILDNFCSKPCELKAYDSDKHGKFLIEEKPEVNELILSWLRKYL